MIYNVLRQLLYIKAFLGNLSSYLLRQVRLYNWRDTKLKEDGNCKLDEDFVILVRLLYNDLDCSIVEEVWHEISGCGLLLHRRVTYRR